MKKSNRFTNFTLTIASLLSIFVFGYFWWDINNYDYQYRTYPIDDNAEYTITYDKHSGNYVLDNVNDTYSQYISTAPASLDPYLNKKVKIKGQFGYSKRIMQKNGYHYFDWNPPVGSVAITEINFTK